MPLNTTIITGKDVIIKGVKTGGKVMIRRTSDTKASHASGQGGIALRPDGNVDFEGFVWAWGNAPLVNVNALFDLGFNLSSTGGGLKCDSTICTGLELIVPVNDPTKKNRVYYKLHFACNGVDLSTGSLESSTAGTPYSSKGLSLTFGGADQACLAIAHVKVFSTAISDVNSCTNSIYVRPAGNIDWKVTWERRINALSSLPALNARGVVAVAGWSLDCMITETGGEFAADDPTALSATVVAEAAGLTGTSNASYTVSGLPVVPTP